MMRRPTFEAEEPSLRKRLEVHRHIEWMRVHDTWPDELDAKEDMLGALADAGVDVPEEGVVQQLLFDEVARELERSAYLADRAERQDAEPWAETEESDCPPVDPFGELAGGRVGRCQLLARRVEAPSAADGAEGEEMALSGG